MSHLGVRALVVALLALGPAPGLAAADQGAAAAIVVNEMVAGTYVELRNVSQSTVDISAYNLWLCDTNAVVGHLRLAVGRQLDPGEFYVVASSSFTGGSVDQLYLGMLPRGGAMLLDPSYDWVDGVADVPNSPCGQGNPAPACPGRAIARDLDSTNTGDNARDFACRTMSPGAPNG